MDPFEQKFWELDEETRTRLIKGRYHILLKQSLPPEENPQYRVWYYYALAAIGRGRDCVSLLSSFLDLKGASVLDFGCGDGGLAVAFAQAGARVTAIDTEESRIEKARALAEDFGVQIDFRVDREYGRSLPPSSFDLILCNDVIEHVDSFSALAQAHQRLLKPGGILYLNPPNRFSPRYFLKDPHYGLLGVSLLNRKLGEWYVVKFRKRVPQYTVNHLLRYGEVIRLYRSVGIELFSCSEDQLKRRIHDRSLPFSWKRALARHLPSRLWMPLVRTLLMDQWIMIGRRSKEHERGEENLTEEGTTAGP